MEVKSEIFERVLIAEARVDVMMEIISIMMVRYGKTKIKICTEKDFPLIKGSELEIKRKAGDYTVRLLPPEETKQ